MVSPQISDSEIGDTSQFNVNIQPRGLDRKRTKRRRSLQEITTERINDRVIIITIIYEQPILHFTSLASNERNPLQMRVWCDFGRFSAHFFFFFDFGTAWSPIRIKIGYLGGPQENPDKTSPKAPKNRPDKNSGFGPLQDQGVQGIIGGPVGPFVAWWTHWFCGSNWCPRLRWYHARGTLRGFCKQIISVSFFSLLPVFPWCEYLLMINTKNDQRPRISQLFDMD